MGTSKDRDPAAPSPYAGIPGIAAGRSKALAAAGVPDRAALARQRPEQLYERLRAAGATGLSLEGVSRWVAKARTLEGVEGPPAAGGDVRAAPYAEPPDELLEGWIRTASFSLWFARDPRRGADSWRSIVYHEGGAGEWVVLDGLDTWADWIAERARLPGRATSLEAPETAVPPATPAAPEAPEAPVAREAPDPPEAPEIPEPVPAEETTAREGDVAPPPSRLELTTVEVSQLHGGFPAIEATVRASLTKPTTAGTEYQAYLQLVDADSGTPMSQAMAQGLVTGRALEMRCALPFPPPGRYRVRSLVALDPDGPPFEYDGPPFRVA